MRRLALIALLLAGALPGAAAAAPVSVSTGLDECRAASSATNGYAIFRADMRAVPGTSRMWVRFDLLVREAGDVDYRRLATEPNGWIRSEPGVDRFIWHKRFEELRGPADYRALVRFRWVDDAGDVLETAQRRTVSCTQPDQRPDLGLGTLSVAPGPQSDLMRYVIAVRNDGRGDAGPFDVGLRIGGRDALLVTVAGAMAGQSQPLTFVGPRCVAGERVRIEADPGDRVAEADERDNVLSLDCPV